MLLFHDLRCQAIPAVVTGKIPNSTANHNFVRASCLQTNPKAVAAGANSMSLSAQPRNRWESATVLE